MLVDSHAGTVDTSNLSTDFVIVGGQFLTGQSLTQAQSDANAASAAAAALTPTVSLGNLTSSATVTAAPGTNVTTVISLTSWVYNGATLTLSGNASDVFIINDTGDLQFSQSKLLLSGGLTADHVLVNLPNASTTVTDINKATNVWNATLLAPYRSVRYHNPANFNGAIIAQSVQIDSSGILTGNEPCIPGVPVTITGPTTQTTTTTVNGYRFFGLSAGTYSLSEGTPPSGLTKEVANPGTGANVQGTASGTDQITNIGLSGGNNAVDYDFGLVSGSGTSPQLAVYKTADASTITGGQAIGFTVTVADLGSAGLTGLTLNDPLPYGAGNDMFWTIDTGTGQPADFQIGGSQGRQVLALSINSLSAGQVIAVHLTSPTNSTDATTSSPAATGFDTTGTTAAGIISLGMLYPASNANNYGLLGLAITKINNSLVTIHGNEGVSQGGTLTNQAPSTITGNVYEYAKGQYSGPGTLGGSTIVNSTLLSQNDANALKASTTAAALTPDFTFGSITTTTTVTATAASRADGVTVVQINGSISLNNASLTLSGSASDVFVVNVTGNAAFVGTGGLTLAGGMTANHVLYNFTGSSGTIQSNVGNVFYGTLLAPQYSLTCMSLWMRGRCGVP